MKKTLLLLSTVVLTAAAALAQTVQTFNYTGSVQTFTVPAFVAQIIVDCKGAQGGGQGALGGRVQCVLPVNPGDVLNIYVGGQGGAQITNSPGGFNGGGNGGTASVQQYAGCGGGGASDIRLNGTALTDRVVVAGGGGGAHPVNGGAGGAGGGLIGGSVISNGNTCMNGWATGGTQTAGGLNSTWSGTCCQFTPNPDGSLGLGGNGAGPATSCNNGDAGSGGGGGYYGGGAGGTYTAGAGGSSYTDSSCTGVVHTQGSQTGDGQVILTFSSVSVEELFALQQIVVYPNPAKDNLVIAFPQNLGSATCSILDVQGRVIMENAYTSIQPLQNTSLDVASLENGVYMVRFTSGKNSVVKKIVISH